MLACTIASSSRGLHWLALLEWRRLRVARRAARAPEAARNAGSFHVERTEVSTSRVFTGVSRPAAYVCACMARADADAETRKQGYFWGRIIQRAEVSASVEGGVGDS